MTECVTFNANGTNWRATSMVDEENSLFRWIKVTAVWSGFGPQPIFPQQPRTFFWRRQRKSDGTYVLAGSQ